MPRRSGSRSLRSWLGLRQDQHERALAALPDMDLVVSGLDLRIVRMRRRVTLGVFGDDQIDLDEVLLGRCVDLRGVAPLGDARIGKAIVVQSSAVDRDPR